MDPAIVPPPSPDKSPPPPPPNPHTPINAIIDAPGFDCYQKCEPSTSRNMDNFKALVLKHAGRLLPAHRSLIERRFDDIFPDDLLVPDHPPYADMILTALWELNTEGGSSEEAISDFIKKEYNELPWAHATMLNHHLRDLCIKRKITMTHDRCYIRCSSITKPVPNPSSIDHVSLDDSSCSSPISSPSASLCSSPSSSSSSLFSGPPYQRHKRQLKRKRKRKRKNLKGRGGKTVQVSGRGRGRGKNAQPKMVQVGEHVTTKARGRGRPSKEVKIGDKSQMEKEQMEVIGGYEDRNNLKEPTQVTEDQNEVIGEVEEDAIQDGALYNVITSNNQQGQEDGAEKQQNHPQKKNNAVVETGQKNDPKWNGNVKEKGYSVGLRRSGRRKSDVSKEENIQSEKHKVGVKEHNEVRWIGRGEHNWVKGCVKQRGSQSKQHANKEQHQPCEQLEEGFKEQDHQRKKHANKGSQSKQHANKEQHQPCEQLEEGFKEQDHQRKRCKVVWLGRRGIKLKEAVDEVTEVEDGVSEEEDAEVDEHVEQSRKNKEKGETNVEHNRPEENQLLDIIEKQILEKEQLMSVPDDNKLPCEQYERLGMKPELVVAENLHLMTRSGTQEDGVIKECNGKQNQVEGESMKQSGSQLQQNDPSGEQVDLQKQSKEETEDKLHTQGQQLEGSMEQDQLSKQEFKMADEQDSVMMQCEAPMTVAIQEKQHDDTVEGQFWPEEQSKEDNKEELHTHEQQNSGDAKQEMPEKQVDMIGKPLQDESNVMTIQYEAPQARAEGAKKTEPEEQHDDLNEEQYERLGMEPELLVAEKLHLMARSGTQEDGVVKEWNGKQKQVEGESMKQSGSQLQRNDLSGEDVDLQKQNKEETEGKLQTQGQQLEGSMEQDQLQKLEVKMADEQDSVMMQCEAQMTVAIQEKQHDDIVEGQIRPEEQSKEVNKEELQIHERQNSGDTKQEIPEKQVDMVGKPLQDESNVMTIQYEAQARAEGAKNTEPEEQHDDLTEEQVDSKEQSKELHNDVIEESIYPQEHCVERINEKPHSCGQDPLENGEAELAEEQPQQEEQQTEVTQKGIAHAMDTEMQQDLVMNQDETEVRRACVIQYATQEKDNAASNENLAASSSTIEGSRSFSCSSVGVKKAWLPDHKHQVEQRQPLRQGLRSSCKKEEATSNTKNQLKQVTPLQRSLRPRKTISEAAVITEKGPDHSKEQLKHSGGARSSKRKPKVAEAEQVSKSQKTRRKS